MNINENHLMEHLMATGYLILSIPLIYLLNMMRGVESDETRQDKRHDYCGYRESEESEIKSLFVLENVHHVALHRERCQGTGNRCL